MIRLLSGDCRDVLPTLPAESVQCVVTSPPYYGLRDYGTALWDGGDAACDHKQSNYDRGERADRGNIMERTTPYRDTCGKCGAVRVDRQIGLEATPDEYLATMVGVFREVRRVLRRDGTCWVNMGDSYAHGASGGGSVFDNGRNDGRKSYEADKPRGRGAFNTGAGLAAKQLLLMPARLALALQADGWWVRSDIIWHKPNPMPESVTDRPTSAHEHVFLLTKSARYYYDADAVREAQTEGTIERFGKNPMRSLGGAKLSEPGIGIKNNSSMNEAIRSGIVEGGRSCRNVWTIATHAYPDAHFATFPPELAERCIKAGTSERGCCAACGKPWVRVVERGDLVPTRAQYDKRPYVTQRADPYDRGTDMSARHRANMAYETTTTGWALGCDHDAPTVPCTVLDPFAGAGTTLLVADRLQRDAIGIELNTAYTEMAMERCRADAPLLAASEAWLSTAFPPAEPPEDERMADLFTDMAAD